MKWRKTDVYNVTEAQVNSKIYSAYFWDTLRIGTVVENRIDNPGRFTRIGGETISKAVSVRNGEVPPLSEPDVTADGGISPQNQSQALPTTKQ